MLSGSRPISALCIHLHPYLVSAAHCISYLLAIHCYPYIAAPCMAMALRHAPLLCNVYSHHTFHPNRLMSLWMWGVDLSVYPHDPRSMDPGSMKTSFIMQHYGYAYAMALLRGHCGAHRMACCIVLTYWDHPRLCPGTASLSISLTSRAVLSSQRLSIVLSVVRVVPTPTTWY